MQLEKQPAETAVRISAAGQSISVTSAILAAVVHDRLMDASTAAQLPRLVHRAAVHSEWDTVADIYLKGVLQPQGQLARLPMLDMIICAEPWAVNRPAEVSHNGRESYYTRAWLAVAQAFARICPLLPQSEPAALYGPIQKSNTPVLILNAEEDPQNPAANVARLTEVYPNSKVLFEPYRAHNTTDWSCLTQVVTEFIDLGNVNVLKADCLSKVRPYAFDVRP
jgi:hypothetical protein